MKKCEYGGSSNDGDESWAVIICQEDDQQCYAWNYLVNISTPLGSYGAISHF